MAGNIAISLLQLFEKDLNYFHNIIISWKQELNNNILGELD